MCFNLSKCKFYFLKANYKKKKTLYNHRRKLLNEIFTSRIQQYIKRMIYHDKVEFIPGMQGWFHIQKSISITHHSDRLKEQNHRIFSIDV